VRARRNRAGESSGAQRPDQQPSANRRTTPSETSTDDQRAARPTARCSRRSGRECRTRRAWIADRTALAWIAGSSRTSRREQRDAAVMRGRARRGGVGDRAGPVTPNASDSSARTAASSPIHSEADPRRRKTPHEAFSTSSCRTMTPVAARWDARRDLRPPVCARARAAALRC